VVYWLVRRKKIVILPLLIFIITWSSFKSSFAYNLGNNTIENPSFTLSTWNVRLFDLYNWSGNVASKKKIFEHLKGLNSDIYCFQEFYHDSRKKSNFNIINPLKKQLGAKYHYAGFKHHINMYETVGLITISKYKIIKAEEVHFENEPKNLYIYTDIIIEQDTLRVFNVHLASVKLRKNDYKFIDDLHGNIEEVNLETGFKNILRRLKRAFLLREEQANILSKEIKRSPYPVIVAGDFNDTPSSYCYRVLSDDLSDTFVESGFGIGGTYNGKLKALRIDYILHNTTYKSQYSKGDVNLSDHFPITCKFGEDE
jgi:endonuclease/exonuclease/phosphatase family metal-dependent hydrolase